MEELRSQFVDSRVGRQHYLAAGDGQRLLILHGLGAVSASWSGVAGALAASHRVIVPDLAGHGASEPVSGAINFSIELTGLEAILRAECDRPAILLGHSLGAWLGCLLVYAQPECFSRVVLVNGPMLTPWPAGLSMHPATRDEAARLFQATGSSRTPAPTDAMLDAYLSYAKTGPIGRFVFDYEAWKPYFLNDRLRQFPRPVDMIWGMEDELVTYENAQVLLSHLPRARATQLTTSGHLPHLDNAEVFLETLGAVLSLPAPEAAQA